ncbi:MAG: hypothetical protein JJU01_09080 [Alkalibacterium sp.]|nr:hypothetical protein [Alkalibacterium sp.]
MKTKTPKFWKMFLVAMIPAVIFAFLGENSNVFALISVFLLVTIIESYIYKADKE